MADKWGEGMGVGLPWEPSPERQEQTDAERYSELQGEAEERDARRAREQGQPTDADKAWRRAVLKDAQRAARAEGREERRDRRERAAEAREAAADFEKYGQKARADLGAVFKFPGSGPKPRVGVLKGDPPASDPVATKVFSWIDQNEPAGLGASDDVRFIRRFGL